MVHGDFPPSGAAVLNRRVSIPIVVFWGLLVAGLYVDGAEDDSGYDLGDGFRESSGTEEEGGMLSSRESRTSELLSDLGEKSGTGDLDESGGREGMREAAVEMMNDREAVVEMMNDREVRGFLEVVNYLLTHVHTPYARVSIGAINHRAASF